MTDEKLYAIWNATPHSIDKLRMIAEFGRTLYRMGQEEMRERAADVCSLDPHATNEWIYEKIIRLETKP